MGDSDKTAALKAAYAEVILNTAKEAAARVILSEKRAASFQLQLKRSKEESLRLLLRLKHMLDIKTIEAERTSFYQKRKIDELEAQLHEAEDIIIDLRAELDCLRDKLGRAKNTQVKPLSGQNTCEDSSSLKDPTFEPMLQSPLSSGYATIAVSDISNNVLNQGNCDNICCNAAKKIDQPYGSHVESYCPHNSDVTTVLMASKKPELCRNACTQRICAPERNMTDSKLTPGSLDADHSLLKNECSMETSAPDETQCNLTSPKTKSLKGMNFSREETKKSLNARTMRRKTRFSRIKAGSCRSRLGWRMRPGQSYSVLSRCRTYTTNRSVKCSEGSRTVCSIGVGNMDRTKSSRELQNELKHNGKIEEATSRNDIATSFQSPSDQLSDPCQSSTVISCFKTLSSVCSNVKSNEDQVKIAETEAKTKPLACLDPGLTLVNSNVDPLSGSENVTVIARALHESRLVQSATDNGMKLGDEAILIRQECNSGEISILPSSEMSSNIVNVSFMSSEFKDAIASNVTNEFSTKVDSVNYRLKYTFQRKRKKECLSNLDEKTSEDSSSKRRAGEKENSLTETVKSNLVNESSS